MNNFTNIQNIGVNKIYPHPDNSRKDAGDMAELVESMKGRGIMLLRNIQLIIKEGGAGIPLFRTGHNLTYS